MDENKSIFDYLKKKLNIPQSKEQLQNAAGISSGTKNNSAELQKKQAHQKQQDQTWIQEIMPRSYGTSTTNTYDATTFRPMKVGHAELQVPDFYRKVENLYEVYTRTHNENQMAISYATEIRWKAVGPPQEKVYLHVLNYDLFETTVPVSDAEHTKRFMVVSALINTNPDKMYRNGQIIPYHIGVYTKTGELQDPFASPDNYTIINVLHSPRLKLIKIHRLHPSVNPQVIMPTSLKAVSMVVFQHVQQYQHNHKEINTFDSEPRYLVTLTPKNIAQAGITGRHHARKSVDIKWEAFE